MSKVPMQSFSSDVLVSSSKSVLYFSAEWCGPCKQIKPALEKLASEYPEIPFMRVDVDDHPEQAEKFMIRGVPTLVVTQEGAEVFRSIGNVSKLDEYLKTA